MGLGIKTFIKNTYYKLSWRIGQKIIPQRVERIRKKDIISVGFTISEMGMWKTENLYSLMKKHPRFSPILIVLPNPYNDASLDNVIKFLEEKNYKYIVVKKNEFIRSKIKVDILFYHQPYWNSYYPKHRHHWNQLSLFAYVNYGLRGPETKDAYDLPLLNEAWQVYFENEDCLHGPRILMQNKSCNAVITGTPIQDSLIEVMSDSKIKDPWKKNGSTQKKRIIYAPHHTIPEARTWLQFSTFTEYGEFILELAEKYQSQIQLAFKPHPLLEPKLRKIWGNEKTDRYFNRWRLLENTQLAEGQYLELFKYSDAIIHDCGSFTLEYMYTRKPAMYLVGEHATEKTNFNAFWKEAYSLHYMGKCKEDIEQFIVNVINGEDSLCDARNDFYTNRLIPPNNKTACENIIDALLGNERFK